VISLENLNALNEADFVALAGPLFEHSPWIAKETWPGRPFHSREDLLAKLVSTLDASSHDRKLELVRAHPDLAGRLARMGELTPESMQEQAGAGLDRLSPEEARLFEHYNTMYKTRFGFPFVICARLSDKTGMLRAFERRLLLSPGDELQTALDEIKKIASLRLMQLIPMESKP